MADTDNVNRFALYVGSFAVSNDDLHDRTFKIQKELEELRVFERSKSVCICISIRGLKICSKDRSTVYMAHALRRISYATCDAAHKQVAFVAREPTSEASLQYCHVFVTENSVQAEELNRIVGDAFQLAYLWQRLGKQDLKEPDSAVGTNRIPRLCDLHAQWPNSARSCAPTRSVLNVLDLPPPPTYPPSPPPPSDSNPPDTSSHCASPLLAGSRRASDSDCPFDTSQKNGPEPSNNADTLEERLRRISTPQVMESTFRRRQFLRRDDIEKRLSGISDAQILGGSTRQPKRRPCLGWTGLFASTRHSAFIPTTHVVKGTEPSDLLELINAQKSPNKPHIFVDLRTFAGGSPVVALKERLDAQAVANAKASAFAEAAAVLAAAKQASARSSTSSQDSVVSVPNGITAQTKPDSCPPSTSTSPCSTTSTHSESVQAAHLPNGSTQSPPTPPLRLHSLRHSEGLIPSSAPQKHVVSSPVPGRFYTPVSSNGSGTDTRTALDPSNCDSCYVHPSQSATGNGYPHYHREMQIGECGDALPQFARAFQPPSVFPTASSNSSQPHYLGDCHRASVAVADQRSRLGLTNKSRRSFWPVTSVSSQDQQQPIPAISHRSYKPRVPEKPLQMREHPVFSSSQSPLHVAVAPSSASRSSVPTPMNAFVPSEIASLPGWSAAPPGRIGGVAPGIMSTSTVSAETPTPTATPTPTPTQTPQPIQHRNSGDSPSHWPGSQEEWEALRQAPWFQGLLPRQLAFELLAQKEVGSFLVRNSATHPDCCALSVRVPTQDNSSGITHYLIQHTPHGVRLKGLDKEWPSLHALITHLTVIPEMLPCPLRLSTYTSNPVFTQADKHPFVIRYSKSDIEHSSNGSSSADIGNMRLTNVEVTLPSRFAEPASTSSCHQSTTPSHDSYKLHPGCPTHPTSGDQARSNSFPAYTGSGTSHLQANQWRSNSLGWDGVASPPSNLPDVSICAVTNAQTYLGEERNTDVRTASVDGSFTTHDATGIDADENDEDEEYQRLSDFSSILADLRLEPSRELVGN